MKRKIILATVLCLAVAALGIGAAPALAAGGCTCHTVEPLTAPTPHAPYVASITDCTVCHRGMAVPHPRLVDAKLSFGAGLPIAPYLKGSPVVDLSGQLTRPSGRGLNRVGVYLQQRVPGETAFVNVRRVATFRITFQGLSGPIYVDGNFAGPVTSPVWGATYRAVSRGVAVAGRPVVKPTLVETLLQPSTRIGLRGLDAKWRLKLGLSVTAHGRAFPVEVVAGETATFTLVRERFGKQIVAQTAEVTIGSTGRFSWTVTPARTGMKYWIYFTVAATAAHTEFGEGLGTSGCSGDPRRRGGMHELASMTSQAGRSAARAPRTRFRAVRERQRPATSEGDGPLLTSECQRRRGQTAPFLAISNNGDCGTAGLVWRRELHRQARSGSPKIVVPGPGVRSLETWCHFGAEPPAVTNGQ